MARGKDRQPGMTLMPFGFSPASGAARGRDGVSAQVNQAVFLSSHVREPPCQRPRTLVPEARPTVQLSIIHVLYVQYPPGPCRAAGLTRSDRVGWAKCAACTLGDLGTHQTRDSSRLEGGRGTMGGGVTGRKEWVSRDRPSTACKSTRNAERQKRPLFGPNGMMSELSLPLP